MTHANKKKILNGECKLTDKELIYNLINDNDILAYDELWGRYKGPINYFINTIIKNKEDAEELTSEAICKAFLNINKYDFNYNFSTWLYRISTNAAIDFLRKKKLKTESINKFSRGDEGEAYELPIEDNNLNPLECIIRDETVELVNNAIDSLDENAANLIRLKHIAGKTYLEIAEENNTPIGTIKTHVFRAIKQIEQNLKTEKDLLC